MKERQAMKKRKLQPTRVVGFILFLVLIIFMPERAALQGKIAPRQNFQASGIFERGKSGKLESVLQQLVEVYWSQGSDQAREFARLRGIDLEGELVRVVAEAEPTNIFGGTGKSGYSLGFWLRQLFGHRDSFQASAVQSLSTQIEACGGKVEASHRRLVQSVVPLHSLLDLAHSSSTRYIRLPHKPFPFATSEGVEITGADQWQAVVPYRSGGAGVKVCVLDLGFSGYEALLGTELPSSVTVRSFRADGNINASGHGTACAEVLHDMAPEAELLLVNFGTDIEHHNAVNWIIEQGVSVISCSVGWFNVGAGDGTGSICEDVKKAYESGIIWVNAAGNCAERHWQRDYSDPNGNQWCNFAAPGQPEDEWFEFNVVAGNYYSIFLNWNDWGAWNGTRYVNSEGNDYDLYLYDSGGAVLTSSNNNQTDPLNPAPPVESITYYADSSGLRYIRITEWLTSRDCRLELFFLNTEPLDAAQQDPEGSISIPSDSPFAVAVGATYWQDDSYESYSSRGPTSDGRVKPDFTAPTGVSSASLGALSFFGTSASVPHVAGAFALLKSKLPYSLDLIGAIIEGRAKELGVSGKDNLFGLGRLNLLKETGTEIWLGEEGNKNLKSSASFGKFNSDKSDLRSKKKDSDRKGSSQSKRRF